MSAKKIIYYLASVTVLFTALSKTASAAIIQQTFADFQGTFEPVNLLINGEQVSTGVISVNQNPNLPSIATFDTDTNQATFDLNFLLDFPLLTSLGLEPIPIAPFETGVYTVDGQDLIADVTGQSVATGDSPFAGTTGFFQVRWRVTSPLDTSVFLGRTESDILTLCPPSSECVQITGTGVAGIGRTSVPEPGAIAGTIVAGATGCWMKRKRKESW